MRFPRFVESLYDGFVEGGLKFFRKLSRNNSAEEIKRKTLNKLESIGMLTATIEHDISTPLMNLSSGLIILRNKYNNNHKLLVDLKRIEHEVLKIKRIIRLLSFLRIDRSEMSRFTENQSLTSIIEGAIRSLKIECKINPEKMFFRFERKHDIYVECYSEMLTQAIFNVLKNSVEAQNYEGVVEIKISKDGTNHEAIIEIKDNGHGIENEFIAELINPSLTGKSNQGIGLFITKKVTRMHRGRLHIESKVGEGTTVSIFLPLYEEKK